MRCFKGRIRRVFNVIPLLANTTYITCTGIPPLRLSGVDHTAYLPRNIPYSSSVNFNNAYVA